MIRKDFDASRQENSVEKQVGKRPKKTKQEVALDFIVENYLKGLNTELAIFKNEETLKDYIETICTLTNKRNHVGDLAFSKNVFN
jgi:hypothetical protein